MSKQTVYHIIEWVVAMAACAYLVYELATYDQYDTVAERLRAMGWQQWVALVVCVALMPVNMALEAWRWQTLLIYNSQFTIHNLSFREAQRQVYYSKLAGVITPWRLGEYPARGLVLVESLEMRDERCSKVESGKIMAKVLSMGAVGSATMTTVIIIAGIAAMIIGDWSLVIGDWRFSYIIVVVAVLLLLGVGLWFAPRLLRRWATVSHKLVAISVGQSFVRLVCWCVQLGLVVWALSGGEISLLRDHVITNTLIYYLLVTITPNVPIVEAGVRGAWAMLLFGTPNAALAGVLLWVINTLLPCVLWPFVRKRR